MENMHSGIKGTDSLGERPEPSGAEGAGGERLSTRERILLMALKLFARDGYEAVSVSAIAGAMGMTKGALYRHFENKRDILDSIVARMIKIDAEHAKQYHVPELPTDIPQEACRSITMREIRAFTLAQFDFWTRDAFAADFRRLLTIEQYRSEDMARLCRDCLTQGPVAYMSGIFRAMQERGLLHPADPELLALEFYAPMWLLICSCDATESHEQARALLTAHMDRFERETSADF